MDQKHDHMIETVITRICLGVQPKKKKKPKPQPEASAQPAAPEATPPEDGKDEMNGFHANGSVMDGESLDSLSEQLDSASLDAAELDSEPASSETTGNQRICLILSAFTTSGCSGVRHGRLCFPAAQLNGSLTTFRSCIEKEQQAGDYRPVDSH